MRDPFDKYEPRLYLLQGKQPVRVADLLIWAREFEQGDRQVADTTIHGVRISTVFLGLDHGHNPDAPPILFETMIFGGEHDSTITDRYSTWSEAEAGHAKAVELVRRSFIRRVS
jgi:hypothetical protein